MSNGRFMASQHDPFTHVTEHHVTQYKIYVTAIGNAKMLLKVVHLGKARKTTSCLKGHLLLPSRSSLARKDTAFQWLSPVINSSFDPRILMELHPHCTVLLLPVEC